MVDDSGLLGWCILCYFFFLLSLWYPSSPESLYLVFHRVLQVCYVSGQAVIRLFERPCPYLSFAWNDPSGSINPELIPKPVVPVS